LTFNIEETPMTFALEWISTLTSTVWMNYYKHLCPFFKPLTLLIFLII